MIQLVESGFVDHPSRLSDEEYARVLDNIVVACVDCAVVCGDKMLLGRRPDEPCKGAWWIMGGRMKPGEDMRFTAQRILRREIGLVVENIDSVIDLQLAISYVWEKRSQPPLGHGCHMIGHYCFTIVDEAAMDTISPSQTQDFLSFDWRPILEVAGNTSYHVGMQTLAQRLAKNLTLLN